MKAVKAAMLALGLLASIAAQQSAKGDPEAGRAIFKGKCAECHNADTKEPKEGPGLLGLKNGKMPSGRPATRVVILDLVTKGQESMPAFKDVLTEQQREDVTAYAMTL